MTVYVYNPDRFSRAVNHLATYENANESDLRKYHQYRPNRTAVNKSLANGIPCRCSWRSNDIIFSPVELNPADGEVLAQQVAVELPAEREKDNASSDNGN